MEDGAFQDGSPMAPGEDIENNLKSDAGDAGKGGGE
jgi:hypothetical protein